MNLKKSLIISSLFLSSCADYGLKPVKGYLCIYDREMDTAYCQNLTNKKDEKQVKGPNLDGWYLFDQETFKDLQRFKSDAEKKLRECRL